MTIEYIKDCEDPRKTRSGIIPKGKKLTVSKEFGEQEIKAKRAKALNAREENEFLHAVLRQNEGEE